MQITVTYEDTDGQEQTWAVGNRAPMDQVMAVFLAGQLFEHRVDFVREVKTVTVTEN